MVQVGCPLLKIRISNSVNLSSIFAATLQISIPDSVKLLEMIRPIDLTMMVITKHLILIDQIQPSEQWVESLKPEIVKLNPLSSETLKKWESRYSF